jgi:hypothetical protein
MGFPPSFVRVSSYPRYVIGPELTGGLAGFRRISMISSWDPLMISRSIAADLHAFGKRVLEVFRALLRNMTQYFQIG